MEAGPLFYSTNPNQKLVQLLSRYHRVTCQPFIFVGFIDFVTFGVVRLHTLFPARFWLAIFCPVLSRLFVNQSTFSIAQFFGYCRPDDFSVLCAVIIPILHQRVIKGVFPGTTLTRETELPHCVGDNQATAPCAARSDHVQHHLIRALLNFSTGVLDTTGAIGPNSGTSIYESAPKSRFYFYVKRVKLRM